MIRGRGHVRRARHVTESSAIYPVGLEYSGIQKQDIVFVSYPEPSFDSISTLSFSTTSFKSVLLSSRFVNDLIDDNKTSNVQIHV